MAKFNKGGVAWNKGIKKLNPYEYVFDCHGNPHVEVEIFSETHGSKIMRINVEHESLLKDGAVYLTYDKKMKSCYANQKINEKMTRFHRRLFPDIKPEERVDHIYGDTLDNRVDFLRATTSKENGRNTKNHRAGRLRGTCYDKKRKKWYAYTDYVSPRKYLGHSHATELEAHQAVLAYESSHGIK